MTTTITRDQMRPGQIVPTNGRRERLWLSPGCITAHQEDLFGGVA